MLGVGVSQGLVRPKQFLGGHGTATSPELGGNFVGRAESRQLWHGWWVGGAVYQGTGTTELPDTVLPLNLLALTQVCHQPWPGLSLHSEPRPCLKSFMPKLSPHHLGFTMGRYTEIP